jgi:hypothetical protein
MQRMGASRSGQWQSLYQWRLAPTADGGRSLAMGITTVRSDYIVVLALLLVRAWASGNPVVIGGPSSPWGAVMTSEHLLVELSDREASFKGEFTFRLAPRAGAVFSSDAWKAEIRELPVEIPVWFPDNNTDDPSVATFWSVFQKA